MRNVDVTKRKGTACLMTTTIRVFAFFNHVIRAEKDSNNCVTPHDIGIQGLLLAGGVARDKIWGNKTRKK
jgi:hypothetical protein